MAAASLIMVVDDDAAIRDLVKETLTKVGHEVIDAGDPEEALAQMEKSLPDLMLVDIKMPKMSGLELVEKARKLDPCASIIMLSGEGSIQTAVEAIKLGAADFIEKPFNIEALRERVGRALASQTLRREVMRIRGEQCRRFGQVGSLLIGAGPKMAQVYRIVRQVAKSPTTTVLIQGESGTGKELVAKAVHLCSDRRNERFMDINCAALTETLLEAELFGYEKGAFTGAAGTGKAGLIEVANGGTVFLDEIGEMSLPLQAKLLRILQEKRFKRVGGTEDIEVDVRIIASTNRDLEEMVKEGTFRLDLFYRLRVVPIQVPALRERTEDIYPIAQHFAELFSAEMGRKVAGFTPAARASIESHSWPGNVRELKNVIERAVILSSAEWIDTDALMFGSMAAANGPRVEFDMSSLTIADMEKQLIKKVLDNTAWRRAEAARILGINRTTLYNKIRDYSLLQGQC